MSDNEKNSVTAEDKTTLRTNMKSIITIAVLILAVGLGGFMAWAFLAPLDEGVVSQGVVSVISYRKIVQHQHGGTVQEILVKEGDKVKKGQTLMRLNDSQPKATLSNVRGEYFASLALYTRLMAEAAMSPNISFPSDLISKKNVPEIREAIQRQEDIFKARKRVLQDEKKILLENIEGFQEYIRGIEDLQKSRGKQLEIITRQINSLRPLADQGYYPRNKIEDMERTMSELAGALSQSMADIARAKKSVSEYKIRINKLEQEYLRDAETQLADVQKKLTALKDAYVAALDVLERTEITSPEDGVIMGLKIHTVGGVIMAGQPILEIVPLNAELIVEAKVMTQDIDRVHEGLKADMRFSVFNRKTTPVAEGEVIYVSADRFVDEATKTPYYLCRVKLTEKGLKELTGKELQPGMPVDVIIKTGERTFMNYLIKPLLNRLAVSFKEQ